tara:strand:- start:4905 stop:6026 length:1122 start_codon:yes stop_codon:yes gene_type:complete
MIPTLALAIAVPSAPDLDVEAYILTDFHTNKIIAEKNSDQRIDPASMTKMMTVYVIDQELKHGRITEEDEVNISEKAWKMEGSRMFIESGKKVKVGDLLRGIIIQSGNDASVAMAEYVAGTEEAFAELMNQYAKKLGMKDTNYMNSTGMPDDDHYTTAKDLNIIAQALIRDFPESYSLYADKWFTFNGIKQRNRNRLLWRDPSVDGIKTGHSSTAGYCLAASAQKDDMRLIAIVAGADSDSRRNQSTQQLLRYGFRFYETHRLFPARQAIENPRIWMGTQKKVGLGITDDLYITIPHGEYDKLDAKIHVSDNGMRAPVKEGTLQGTLTVKLGDTLIAERPVVSLEDIQKGSIWMQFQDYVSLGIHKILKPKDS